MTLKEALDLLQIPDLSKIASENDLKRFVRIAMVRWHPDKAEKTDDKVLIKKHNENFIRIEQAEAIVLEAMRSRSCESSQKYQGYNQHQSTFYKEEANNSSKTTSQKDTQQKQHYYKQQEQQNHQRKPITRFYIDGANIAYWNNNGKGELCRVLSLCIHLLKKGYDVQCIFDASAIGAKSLSESFFSKKDIQLLKKLSSQTPYKKHFVVVTGGIPAPPVLVGETNKSEQYCLISNDKYDKPDDAYFCKGIDWLNNDYSGSQRLFNVSILERSIIISANDANEYNAFARANFSKDIDSLMKELASILCTTSEPTAEQSSYKKEKTVRNRRQSNVVEEKINWSNMFGGMLGLVGLPFMALSEGKIGEAIVLFIIGIGCLYLVFTYILPIVLLSMGVIFTGIAIFSNDDNRKIRNLIAGFCISGFALRVCPKEWLLNFPFKDMHSISGLFLGVLITNILAVCASLYFFIRVVTEIKTGYEWDNRSKINIGILVIITAFGIGCFSYIYNITQAVFK